MKKYIILVVLAICTVSVFAQSQTKTTDVNVGDIFEIGKSENNTYQYIDLPKLNSIRKRGGITNTLDLNGSIVIVTSVKDKKDGTTIVKIKRKDGKRFFRSHHVLTAQIDKAVSSGELRVK